MILYWNYDCVEMIFGDMSEVELKVEFRFGSGEINFLYEVLRIFELFICINGIVVIGLEGLLMFLKCFVYLCCFGDMIFWFGCLIFELSLIFLEVIEFIVSIYGYFF